MIETLYGRGALDTPIALFAALLIGAAFGFALERAGFGSSRRLSGVFYLKDMAVIKVMFSAITSWGISEYCQRYPPFSRACLEAWTHHWTAASRLARTTGSVISLLALVSSMSMTSAVSATKSGWYSF